MIAVRTIAMSGQLQVGADVRLAMPEEPRESTLENNWSVDEFAPAKDSKCDIATTNYGEQTLKFGNERRMKKMRI